FCEHQFVEHWADDDLSRMPQGLDVSCRWWKYPAVVDEKVHQRCRQTRLVFPDDGEGAGCDPAALVRYPFIGHAAARHAEFLQVGVAAVGYVRHRGTLLENAGVGANQDEPPFGAI